MDALFLLSFFVIVGSSVGLLNRRQGTVKVLLPVQPHIVLHPTRVFPPGMLPARLFNVQTVPVNVVRNLQTRVLRPITLRPIRRLQPNILLARTTVYPTESNGPVVQQFWPRNVNTYHANTVVNGNDGVYTRGTMGNINRIVPNFVPVVPKVNFNTNVVLPTSNDGATGMNGPFVGPDFNKMVRSFEGQVLPALEQAVVFPGGNGPILTNADVNPMFPNLPEGQLRPAVPETKPDLSEGLTDPIVTEIKTNVIRGDQTVPDKTGLTGKIVDSSKTNMFGDKGANNIVKLNNSCHQSGCDSGFQCVFAEQFMCPTYIKELPCDCKPGCRLENAFIPIYSSITIDRCGNTCSCNNNYGAIECTQRMCDPNTLLPGNVVEKKSDIGGFQGGFLGMIFPSNPLVVSDPINLQKDSAVSRKPAFSPKQAFNGAPVMAGPVATVPLVSESVSKDNMEALENVSTSNAAQNTAENRHGPMRLPSDLKIEFIQEIPQRMV